MACGKGGVMRKKTEAIQLKLEFEDCPASKLPIVISDQKQFDLVGLQVAMSMINDSDTIWQDEHRIELEKRAIYPAHSGMWGLLWCRLVKDHGFRQTSQYRRSKCIQVGGHRAHEYYLISKKKRVLNG